MAESDHPCQLHGRLTTASLSPAPRAASFDSPFSLPQEVVGESPVHVRHSGAIPVSHKKLEQEALEVAAGSVDLQELCSEMLRVLVRRFDGSATLIYQCHPDGETRALAGTLVDDADEYYRRYAEADPLQTALKQSPSCILHAAELPGWQSYLGSVVYREFQRPRDVHDLLHVRCLTEEHGQAGMIGMVLARSARQPCFSEHDVHVMAYLQRPFRAAFERLSRSTAQDTADAQLAASRVANRLDGYGLTKSERSVLSLIATGASDRDIEETLFISRATVRSHVGQILAKLNVKSRLQAALVANGIIERVSSTARG